MIARMQVEVLGRRVRECPRMIGVSQSYAGSDDFLLLTCAYALIPTKL